MQNFILDTDSSDFVDNALQSLNGFDEVQLANKLCPSWNVYYNLYNPENFGNPDDPEPWEDNSEVYDYFSPSSDSSVVGTTLTVGMQKKELTREMLLHFQALQQDKLSIEKSMLEKFELYTFKNGGEKGGAYAGSHHFEYARVTIERAENCHYSRHDFLKRNLRLDCIVFTETVGKYGLYFDCSWDEEHGVQACLQNTSLVKIGECNFF